MTTADRANSAWMEPDRNVEKRAGFNLASMQQLYPVFYASRSQGVRKFVSGEISSQSIMPRPA